MKLSETVKPITYFKSHSAEVLKNLEEQGTSLIITQNGEARACGDPKPLNSRLRQQYVHIFTY